MSTNLTMPAVPEKAAMWLGHYSTILLLAAVVASIADAATGQLLGWVTTAVWMAWTVAGMSDISYHRERLCERCIAASPLDPQAAVTRWRHVLRLHHAQRIRLAVLWAVIAVDLTVGFLRHPPVWALALTALAAVILGAVYMVTWQHRRLYPWCPFCRWDEGGEHEGSPDVPSLASGR